MPRSAVISLLVAALLATAFGVISRQVGVEGDLPQFDRSVAQAMRDVSLEHDFRRDAMVFFTIMGGIPTMTVLAAVGGIWQWRRGERVLGPAWMLTVIGGALLTLACKAAFDRERPPEALRDPFVHETNESFPSGHAMGAMIGYGMLAYAVMLSVKRRRIKALILVGLALWVGMIGFSRIYLRAHWFSDVIAGFLVGLAWLEFCLAWVQVARSRRESGTTHEP
jgi:membrane-associated phospholipid phosphatase